MISKRSPEVIAKRCDILEKMGFEIQHEDSRVTFPDFPIHSSFSPMEFDFSAVDMDDPKKIMYYVIQKVYERGLDDGKDYIKQELKNLLDIHG